MLTLFEPFCNHKSKIALKHSYLTEATRIASTISFFCSFGFIASHLVEQHLVERGEGSSCSHLILARSDYFVSILFALFQVLLLPRMRSSMEPLIVLCTQAPGQRPILSHLTPFKRFQSLAWKGTNLCWCQPIHQQEKQQ